MYAYLKRAAQENVFVAEIFFDPQTHTERGVPFDTVINGFHRAIVLGYRNYHIKASLILCFLRHLPQEVHFDTLTEAIPHLDKILGVGLDSSEDGHPPHKFKEVFAKARELGLKVVAHAGEEAGPSYIIEALDCLKVSRIDHGVQCLFDEELVKRLSKERVPLTVCPLSNKKLQVNSRYFEGRNRTKELLDRGLMVTINSDDPAYFGGYITDNFITTAEETGLTLKDIHQICCNAFNASFLTLVEKEDFIWKLNQFNIFTGVAPPMRSVSIFGSRSPIPGTPDYEIARITAKLFASRGYRVVTGGYNGIMKAGSQGAREGGGNALGVLAPRVFRNRSPNGNEFLTESIISHSFADRTKDLIDSSHYLIAFPGKLGTLTEILVTWTGQFGPSIGNYPIKKIFVYRKVLGKVITDLVKVLGVSEDEQHVLFFDNPEEVLEEVEKDFEERKKMAVF